MRHFLAIVALVLLFAGILPAGPIVNVSLTGEVVTLDDSFGLLTDVSIGDPFAVSFSYMLLAPDGDPDPGFGIYADSVISASAEVGPHAFTFSAPSSSSLSFIPGSGTHGFLGLGSFENALVTAGPNVGMTIPDPPVLFALQLLAPFGGVLPTDELIPLPTAGWTVGHGLVANRTNSFRVDFSVDLESIQTNVTQPIPEPGTSLLVASGIVGLIGMRRWQTNKRNKERDTKYR